MYDVWHDARLAVLSGAVIKNIMLHLLKQEFLLFVKVYRAPRVPVKELWHICRRILIFAMGTAVAQLVEALRYKSGCRGFDSRWCHWNFPLT